MSTDHMSLSPTECFSALLVRTNDAQAAFIASGLRDAFEALLKGPGVTHFHTVEQSAFTKICRLASPNVPVSPDGDSRHESVFFLAPPEDYEGGHFALKRNQLAVDMWGPKLTATEWAFLKYQPFAPSSDPLSRRGDVLLGFSTCQLSPGQMMPRDEEKALLAKYNLSNLSGLDEFVEKIAPSYSHFKIDFENLSRLNQVLTQTPLPECPLKPAQYIADSSRHFS